MKRQRLTSRWLRSRVRWFARHAGFGDWEIKVVLAPIPPEDDAIADCEASPEYLEATLRFDPYEIQGLRHLDHLIIHELGHLHTWQLAKLAEELAGDDEFKQARIEDALESATTHWDRVLGRRLKAPRVKLVLPRKRRPAIEVIRDDA